MRVRFANNCYEYRCGQCQVWTGRVWLVRGTTYCLPCYQAIELASEMERYERAMQIARSLCERAKELRRGTGRKNG